MPTGPRAAKSGTISRVALRPPGTTSRMHSRPSRKSRGKAIRPSSRNRPLVANQTTAPELAAQRRQADVKRLGGAGLATDILKSMTTTKTEREQRQGDRKSTRLNSSHAKLSYA